MDMQQVQVKTPNRSERAERGPHRLRSSGTDVRGRGLSRQAPVGLRLLLVIGLMLAALLGQSIAVQSHLHSAGNAGWTTSASTSAESGPHRGLSLSHGPASLPADCPLCRELAMSGHYITPAPLAFFKSPPLLPWLFVLPVAALACRPCSHCWQSRAPPR